MTRLIWQCSRSTGAGPWRGWCGRGGYRALNLDGGNVRIEVSGIAKSAIQKALKEARPIDKNLVDAQQARRLLDRLVGYKLSPLLWSKVRRGLSAGRVQTVAVKIICEREKEIKNFVKEEYWTITVEFEQDGEVSFGYNFWSLDGGGKIPA